MRPIPQAAIDFIKQHEGCKLTGYLDSGNLPTVGYGHVGPGVKVGLTIPQSLADLYLKGDLEAATKRLAAVLQEPVLLDLTDNQYAALISFVFNLGCQPQWTIWKLLNARDFDHVPAELMRFVYCKGAKVQGLVNRRAAEVQLWSTAEPGSVADEPSSAVTRTEATPPLPAKPFSPSHIVAAAIAGAGGLAQGAKSIGDTLQPYAEKSELLQHAISYAMTAGGVAAVVVAFGVWMQHRRAAQ